MVPGTGKDTIIMQDHHELNDYTHRLLRLAKETDHVVLSIDPDRNGYYPAVEIEPTYTDLPYIESSAGTLCVVTPEATLRSVGHCEDYITTLQQTTRLLEVLQEAEASPELLSHYDPRGDN